MKAELSEASLLSVQDIGELASKLDTLHQRTLKVIERLQKDIDKRKSAAAERYKRLDELPMAERNRLAQMETSKAIIEIRQAAEPEVNGLLKEAGSYHEQLLAQRVHYAHQAQVLARFGLGSERRAYLEATARACRPIALANLAQLAIGTNDAILAAVVLQENDCRREADRGFLAADFLDIFKVPDFDKVREFLRIGENRLQGIVLAIRSWRAGKASPLNTVVLAMRRKDEVDLDQLLDGN